MFELATTFVWWKWAQRMPHHLSNLPYTLKPAGTAHVFEMIEKYRPQTLLEFGHGNGSLITNYKHDLEYWGIDTDVEGNCIPYYEIVAYRNKHRECRFIDGLFGRDSAELPDAYFDMVCSVSVIEHIPKDRLLSVTQEMNRILKPGGISVHSYDVWLYDEGVWEVFQAFEKADLQWIRPKEVNVFWEPRICTLCQSELELLFKRIILENPHIVAEVYTWYMPRDERPAPTNHATILIAAQKK
jgi:SAM-dependent methyltransferase